VSTVTTVPVHAPVPIYPLLLPTLNGPVDRGVLLSPASLEPYELRALLPPHNIQSLTFMNWYMCVLKQTSDIEKRRTHSERERLETSTSTRGGRSPVGASATRGRDPDEGHVIRGSRRREARSCRRREATCRGRHPVGA